MKTTATGLRWFHTSVCENIVRPLTQQFGIAWGLGPTQYRGEQTMNSRLTKVFWWQPRQNNARWSWLQRIKLRSKCCQLVKRANNCISAREYKSCQAHPWHRSRVSPFKAGYFSTITAQFHKTEELLRRLCYNCYWVIPLHQNIAPWNVSHLLIHLSLSSGGLIRAFQRPMPIFRQQIGRWTISNVDIMSTS